MKSKAIYFFMMIFVGALVFSSCGSSKKAPSLNKRKKIDIPCLGEDKSDKGTLRYLGIGKSPDLVLAKREAEANGRQGLAAMFEAKIKRVIEEYSNQYITENKQEIMRTIEGMSQEVITKSISGAVPGDCQEVYENNGNYEYFVVMELDLNGAFSDLDSKISKDDKMFMEWKKEKFREIFDKATAEEN